MRVTRNCISALGLILALAAAQPVRAAELLDLAVEIVDHRFVPAELKAPANTPLRLTVRNRDSTAEEFESVALRREKVVQGGKEMVVALPGLKPGRYKFFGEYHPETAIGFLVVE